MIDDIDHLGNRRVRTIGELAGEEFRKGFLKLKRTVQERMSMMEKGGPDAPQPDQFKDDLQRDRFLLRPR